MSPYAYDELIIMFSDTASSQDLSDFLIEEGMFVVEGPTPVLNCYLLAYNDPNLPYASGNPQDTINGSKKKANQNSAVTGVGLNFLVSTDSKKARQEVVEMVNSCNGIFDAELTGNSPIYTSIFDTGITKSKRVWNGYYDPSSFGFDFVYNSNHPTDNHNHGTHMSSIISQNIVNGNGALTLSAYKTQGDDGVGSVFDAIKAIDKAISEGINIVNMSFSYNVEATHGAEPKSAIRLAIDEAESMGGILFVASAGNDSNDNDFQNNVAGLAAFPSSLPNDNIISVASADCNKMISSFSNYGQESVDVFAPGEDIIGKDRFGKPLVLSGTSQATAYVTQLATYLGMNQAIFDWEDVKCAILEGTEPSPSIGKVLTDGFINYENSMAILLNNPCGTGNYIGHSNDQEEAFNLTEEESGTYSIQSNKNQNCVMQIIDPMGRVFFKQKVQLFEGKHSYEFKDIPTGSRGIYLINIQGDELNKTFKIFK